MIKEGIYYDEETNLIFEIFNRGKVQYLRFSISPGVYCLPIENDFQPDKYQHYIGPL